MSNLDSYQEYANSKSKHTKKDFKDNYFKTDFQRSKKSVLLFAACLTDMGFNCRLPPTVIKDEWAPDDGDLFVEKRIEIKHRTKNFTGPADWPYKKHKYQYKDENGNVIREVDAIIVTATKPWDRALVKPSVHYVLSDNEKHVAIISTKKTFKYWIRKTITRVDEGKVYEVFLCPIDVIEFKKMSDFKLINEVEKNEMV